MQDALEEGFVRRMYLNPERVESLANVCDATLSGLGKGNLATQGRPSLNLVITHIFWLLALAFLICILTAGLAN